MRPGELPAALAAAGARLAHVPAELEPRAAQLILDNANPPRRTSALANSGRVIDNAAVFGGGTVTYAAPVQAATRFLDLAVVAAETAVADLADDLVGDAITL